MKKLKKIKWRKVLKKAKNYLKNILKKKKSELIIEVKELMNDKCLNWKNRIKVIINYIKKIKVLNNTKYILEYSLM